MLHVRVKALHTSARCILVQLCAGRDRRCDFTVPQDAAAAGFSSFLATKVKTGRWMGHWGSSP